MSDGQIQDEKVEYELSRARVLFRDLEHIGRGYAPALSLALSTESGVPVQGTATRLGLLRLAVRLGQAAFSAESVVVVHDFGGISDNTAASDGIIQVLLTDDPPATTEASAEWRLWLLPAFVLTVAGFSIVGFVMVLRWIVENL